MRPKLTAYLKLICSMVIFGSIGLFVRKVDISTASIALVRAFVGALFLLVISLFSMQKLSLSSIRKHVFLLLFSGAALGFNWIALFESYKYASVAVATLCYYTAPMIVILLSPVFLKEKMTANKLICVAVAVLGMVFVSGVSASSGATADPKGILLGLVASVLYASVIMMNKIKKDIPTFDRTVFQLGTAAVVLLPYCFLSGNFPDRMPSETTVFLLIVMGILHTGIAYFLYFSSMEHLPGQTMAIISYIDPVVAVMASVMILQENISWQEMIGAILILGAAVVSELPVPRKEINR